MLFETTAEYDAEITDVKASITRQLKLGASHSNNSGGSSRDVTEVSLNDLRKYLAQLRKERAALADDENGAIVIRAGW